MNYMASDNTKEIGKQLDEKQKTVDHLFSQLTSHQTFYLLLAILFCLVMIILVYISERFKN